MKPTKSGYYWFNDEIVFVNESLNVQRFGSSSVDGIESFNGEWIGPLNKITSEIKAERFKAGKKLLSEEEASESTLP